MRKKRLQGIHHLVYYACCGNFATLPKRVKKMNVEQYQVAIRAAQLAYHAAKYLENKEAYIAAARRYIRPGSLSVMPN
jgi:hypothetical protein